MSVLIEIWRYLLDLAEVDPGSETDLTPVIPPNG